MQNNNQSGRAGNGGRPPVGGNQIPGADPRQRRRPASGRMADGAAGLVRRPGSSPPPTQRHAGGSTGSMPARRIPPEEPGRSGSEKPKRQYRWFRAFLMVIATLGLCVFLSVFILDSAQDLFGLNQPDKLIELTIPKGASNREVSDLLYEKGVITKNLTFFVYSKIKVEEDGFQPGNYLFNTNMGYDQIIVSLRAGNRVEELVKGLTFIEGLTLQEVARRLEENKVCDAQEFIDYLETGDFDYEFMDRMPSDPLRFRRMEGYIFPDTYDFYVDENVKSVAKKFLDNFRNKITEDMEAKMLDLGLTLDETISLASVIEKEAGYAEEMRRVSAVFHNRLNDSATYPQLQSDVTIFYVEKLIKPYIQTKNQDVYDAYNTYVRNGLPVGPICNPGAAAIEAALNPATEDSESGTFTARAKFFVTDVNGVFYYAETAEKHYENVRFAEAQDPIGENSGEVHGTGVQGN